MSEQTEIPGSRIPRADDAASSRRRTLSRMYRELETTRRRLELARRQVIELTDEEAAQLRAVREYIEQRDQVESDGQLDQPPAS